MPVVINGSGSVTGLSTLSFPNGDGTVTGVATMSGLANASIPAVKIGAGAVLQVVQTVKSDTFTMAGATYTTVTGLTATISPTSASSKILVMVMLSLGGGYYGTNGRLIRNSTAIGLGDQVTSRPRTTFGKNTYVANQTYEEYHLMTIPITYLDSPATTSATTYSIQLANYSSYTTAVNRSVNFQDGTTYDPTTISTITLMEIAQ